MTRLWLALAGLNGLSAVALGAYAAHASAAEAGRLLRIAADYQMWHAPALLGVAWLAAAEHPRPPRALVAAAGTGFALGILLFSGSLIGTALTGHPPLPLAAPAGGAMLMGGWLALALCGLFGRYASSSG